MNNENIVVRNDITINEALKCINSSARQILFAVDEDNKLSYSLSDGDIRRYLLAGGDLSGKASEAGCKNPKCASDKDNARRIYDSKYCIAVPIVDSEGHVIDIFIGDDDIIFPNLGIPVVINAGGRGTRLDPYTRVLPKPLIPIGDMPIIEHIMQEYIKYGCNVFHMIVNYKKQLIKTYFNESDNEYNLTFYDENEPLGTGGGLCYLKGRLDGTFFFINCDNLLRADYENIIRFHKDQGNMITMICARKNTTIPYGVVKTDEDGNIIDMKEKPEMSFLVNTGIYVVESEILNDIDSGKCISFPEIIDNQRNKGRKTSVYTVDESQWMDMGQISELEKMRKKICGE